jgi:hypothetical protein
MRGINWSRVVILLAFVGASVGTGLADPSPPAGLPLETGVWLKKSGANALSADDQQRLVESLRRITGFCELQFGPDGLLSIGPDSRVKDGAGTARTILQGAMRSGVIFVIEDHSGSEAVHFGQLEPFWFMTSEPRREVEIKLVRLDFKDFRQMQASAIIRKTFDEGFTLLHEILHGLGYQDAFGESELGACEQIVNQARAELGLPLRERYLAEVVPITEQFTTLRLKFRSGPSDPKKKARSHYLFFLVRDNLKSIEALAAAARITRARLRASGDKSIGAKTSLAIPAQPVTSANAPPD